MSQSEVKTKLAYMVYIQFKGEHCKEVAFARCGFPASYFLLHNMEVFITLHEEKIMTISKLAIALAFLGFTITANAGKPLADQTLVTPALPGSFIQCSVVNVSDRTIDFELAVVDIFDDGDRIPLTLSFAPGEIHSGWSGSDITVAYCVFRWVGEADDLLVTVCNTETVSGLKNCVNGN